MNPGSLARDTSRPVSLNDFLEHFKSISQERVEMTSRLKQAFDEIESLRSQLGNRSHDTLMETKERLIREEFERKYQDLLVEVRKERTKHGQQVKELKEKLSSCICDRPKNAEPFWNSRRQGQVKSGL